MANHLIMMDSNYIMLKGLITCKGCVKSTRLKENKMDTEENTKYKTSNCDRTNMRYIPNYKVKYT